MPLYLEEPQQMSPIYEEPQGGASAQYQVYEQPELEKSEQLLNTSFYQLFALLFCDFQLFYFF